MRQSIASLTDRTSRRILGYDYFISYAHSDAIPPHSGSATDSRLTAISIVWTGETCRPKIHSIERFAMPSINQPC